MTSTKQYGLEEARARLPHIAAEASAGYTSVITRHSKPVAVVVPAAQWEQDQARKAQLAGATSVLSLRGSGKGLWPRGAGTEVARLRQEWER